MKKIILISGLMLLFSLTSITAFASTYTFEGAEQANFGKHTEVADTYVAPSIENVKVNKDSAFIPPKFGSRTADTPETGELLTPNISGVPPMALGGTGETVYIYAPSAPNTGSGGSSNPSASTGWVDGNSIKQADGSIGRLEISAIGVNTKVYEGEHLSNLAKGAGHYSCTSAWSGNVAICAHNRGTNAIFGRIHTLQNGDIITYSTSLGTMRFSVFSVRQVNEYDTSCLNPTAENIITLTTCVRDIPSLRWVVQAKQI